MTPTRRIELALVAVVGATAVPYALLGPGYVLDDWFALANARYQSPLMAAGRDQWLARPGAGMTYAFVFGALGRRPLAAYVVLAIGEALAAVLLFRLGRRVWDQSTGLAVAMVWVLLPNHSSTSYWPSAANISAALVLLLLGWLVIGAPSLQRELAGAALLAAAALFYEATIPVAVLGTWWLARRAGTSPVRPVVMATAAIGAAGVWLLAFWHPAKRGIAETADLRLLVPAHFGWGVFTDTTVAYVVGTAAVVAAAVIVVRAVHPRYRVRLAPEEHLAAAGVAVIVAGALPFVRYFFQPLGAGDRVNVVSSVGAAAVWAALVLLTRRRAGTAVAVALSLMLAGAFVVTDLRAARTWSAAGRDAARTVARLEAERPCREPVVVEQTPVRRNVTAFLDTSNAQGAAAIACADPAIAVRLVPPRSVSRAASTMTACPRSRSCPTSARRAINRRQSPP